MTFLSSLETVVALTYASRYLLLALVITEKKFLSRLVALSAHMGLQFVLAPELMHHKYLECHPGDPHSNSCRK